MRHVRVRFFSILPTAGNMTSAKPRSKYFSTAAETWRSQSGYKGVGEECKNEGISMDNSAPWEKLQSHESCNNWDRHVEQIGEKRACWLPASALTYPLCYIVRQIMKEWGIMKSSEISMEMIRQRWLLDVGQNDGFRFPKMLNSEKPPFKIGLKLKISKFLSENITLSEI